MIFFLIGCVALILLLIMSCRTSHDQGLKNNPQVRELARHVSPNKILTPHERKMYQMLKDVVPKNYSIMCQVSFNALIKCSDIHIRNQFNRKYIDFIIVNQEFMPILCIELDDSTHTQAAVIEKDKFRDNLLSAALIPTERFKGLPKNKQQIKSRIDTHFTNPKNKKIYKALEHTK